MCDPGMLRETIVFQKISYEQDEYLNAIEKIATVKKVRGYVNNLAESEGEGKATTFSEKSILITARWSKFYSDLDTKQVWILFRGKQYNIKSVDNVMYKNETVKIKAEIREN